MIYRKEKRITPSRSVALPVIARHIIQTIPRACDRGVFTRVCAHAFTNAATSVGALWAVSNAHALTQMWAGYAYIRRTYVIFVLCLFMTVHQAIILCNHRYI